MNQPACEIYEARCEVADRSRFLRELRAIADEYRTSVVVFDAARMAGREHVTAALHHAWRSFYEGTPIANSFEMEALLFAAGTRQTSVASGFGIREGATEAYVCICPPAQGAYDALKQLVTFVNEDWEEIDEEKRDRLMKLFAITPQELEVVGTEKFRDLVLERVALLEVYR